MHALLGTIRYSRAAMAKLAEDGRRSAAIAALLDADYDRVGRDIAAARKSGRSIPLFGSGPLPVVGRPCPGDEVVQLAREGLRACDIAARIGDPASVLQRSGDRRGLPAYPFSYHGSRM